MPPGLHAAGSAVRQAFLPLHSRSPPGRAMAHRCLRQHIAANPTASSSSHAPTGTAPTDGRSPRLSSPARGEEGVTGSDTDVSTHRDLSMPYRSYSNKPHGTKHTVSPGTTKVTDPSRCEVVGRKSFVNISFLHRSSPSAPRASERETAVAMAPRAVPGVSCATRGAPARPLEARGSSGRAHRSFSYRSAPLAFANSIHTDAPRARS